MENQTILDDMLGYLSEIYNKCLPVYELINNRKYDREMAIIGINELFTLIREGKAFYQAHPEVADEEIEHYLAIASDFYTNLKQTFFHEEDSGEEMLLDAELKKMEYLFEALTSEHKLF